MNTVQNKGGFKRTHLYLLQLYIDSMAELWYIYITDK